ncbi:chemoreceptor glutamine deamidase CheD [Candidatus Nitrospira nitrificans]|jgi:chemotaxis protein CheD|uniref:Probable chemoreceptor glutamine deamidase CheD n=1 Tax=Candidatus Nitrospira nitrificans TaxID=1742973 RepID=A0A0S4L1C0_9BACT|nr:chemoreceptor glutamine deamidase CheD [Candidatus Nitrospira nitrificans]CUS31468.1 putative chemoreceptor glutamine deamidase CheD [Candidatus Nitrospira nitrificans]
MELETRHMEFAHIRRMRDSRFPYEIASILPGEFFVSREPMIVYTVLGSCISACIRDPIARVGGMNHFMLPEPKDGGSDSWGESTRYGSYAMESLINEILKRGGLKSRLEIKLFGAGKIYEGKIDVGSRNAEWVMNYIKTEGLTACKTDLGDVCPRKIYYFTESGRALMKKIERVKNQTIVVREREYASRIQEKKQVVVEEDVTLF